MPNSPQESKDKNSSGYTSFRDMFDGGGKGGSGSEHSTKSHEQYKSDYREKYGKNDPNARSNSGDIKEAANKGGFTSFEDMFDGGGAGGSGSEHSTKTHEEYKRDYKEKYGRDDLNAKSHRSGESGEDEKKPTHPSLSLDISYSKTRVTVIGTSETGVVIEVQASIDVKIEKVIAVAEAALKYADAVNTGAIYSTRNYAKVRIDMAVVPDADGQYLANGLIQVDYSDEYTGFGRSTKRIVETTLHELTHKYNPGLDKTGTGSNSAHSAEFYEAVDAAGRAISISAGLSGTKHHLGIVAQLAPEA